MAGKAGKCIQIYLAGRKCYCSNFFTGNFFLFCFFFFMFTTVLIDSSPKLQSQSCPPLGWCCLVYNTTFIDIKGLLVQIMEGGQPYMQAHWLVCDLARRFISRCYVAVSVCLQQCGSDQRRWWRPFKPASLVGLRLLQSPPGYFSLLLHPLQTGGAVPSCSLLFYLWRGISLWSVLILCCSNKRTKLGDLKIDHTRVAGNT